MRLLATFAFAIIAGTGYSQDGGRLASLWSPESLKMDGKVSEWPAAAFQFDKKTELHYAVANTGEQIHFALKCTNPAVTRKLLLTGILCVISGKNQDGINQLVQLNIPIAKFISIRSVMGLGTGGVDRVKSRVTDSLMRATNREMVGKMKDIGITGIPAISDSVISIYNDEGILVRALIDKDDIYTVELALPLKFLPLGQKQLDIKIVSKGLELDERTVAMMEGGIPIGLGDQLRPLTIFAATRTISGRYILATSSSK